MPRLSAARPNRVKWIAGEVTALSATSLTAKSTDGFTKACVIDSATATGIKTGEDVTIVATVNGTTATATSVAEAGTQPGAAGTQPGGAGSTAG